jgi:formiminotetrahydrofolate cyclodeaminase
MKLVDLTVRDFIKEIDSTSPAPGGGSVSSLVSGLGSALGRMVGHLTFGKKKFNELDEDIRVKLITNFELLHSSEEKLVELVDRDTDNFNLVMGAFKLPKESDDEKLHRKSEIEKATLLATKTPLEMARESLKIMRNLEIFATYGNQNAITDLGVAALLAEAGAKGAVYNVRINLPGLSDEKLVGEFKKECEETLNEIREIASRIETIVLSKLG